MQELVEYIVKNMVSIPDAVSVEEQSDNGEVQVLLKVDPKDMGMVIGKGGQTIKAIRKLLTVRAMAENVRVYLQIVEPEGYVRPAKSEETREPDQETSEPVKEAAEKEADSEQSEDKDAHQETAESKEDSETSAKE
jgi:uncharacterized protein